MAKYGRFRRFTGYGGRRYGGFDPDAAAFFTAVEGAGGTLSDAVKTEYNSFVLREKANSRYSKLKRLYPYLGGVINSARIDAITLGSATNNNFVDADADATCGLQGDGSTKYLDISVAANVLFSSAIDLQAGVFFKGAVSTGLQRHLSYFDTVTTNNFLSIQTASNINRFYYPNATDFGSVTDATADRSIVGGRFAVDDIRVWVEGVENIDSSITTINTIATLSPYIFAQNTNGIATSFSNAEQAGCFLAETMTPSETTAFESSYRTFLTNIGVI